MSDIPPFPSTGFPVISLPVVDYELLLSGNQAEKLNLWEAATTLGFWYLKNHKADSLIQSMFELGKETMELDFEEKMKYWQGDSGGSFGYKAPGATYADLKGSKDLAEFINISKDDALAFPVVQNRVYPDVITSHMETVVRPFVYGCVEVTNTLLEVFNEYLCLPNEYLKRFHSLKEPSISEARCIRIPVIDQQSDEEKIALGAHTDFGSLSFLINEIGGLQVLPPGETTWRYVIPRKGHAICNIGDALNLLSGGILKSGLHRVVPPPGLQASHERWSLAYFNRPGNSTILNALEDESHIIAESVRKSGSPSTYRPGATSKDWFYRRYTKLKTDNKSLGRGTEQMRVAV